MHLFNALLISFLIAILPSSLTGQANEANTEERIQSATQADRLISQLVKNEKFPGMAVEVWKEGVVVFSKGYGYADIINETPVDPKRSKFRIGSISKPFTAAALGLLYEEGKIDLDVPVQNYVPSFPKKKHEITLRQLAGHLGGIRHYRGSEFMNNEHYPTVGEGLSIFANDRLINEPGTKYSYSSYGWNLISAAIESAAQTEFLSYISKEVFNKIGMYNTEADFANREIENRVSFYTKGGQGRPTIADQVDNSYKWAGGGFLSTVSDMVLFGQAHLEGSLLKPSTVSLFTTSQVTKNGKATNYGIGWRSGEDKKGRKWFGHSGGSVGGTSMLLIFPEEEIIVATTVNMGNARTGNIAFRIADQFFER